MKKGSNDLVLKNKIRICRAEKDMSQQQLAELVGVSRQSIIAIEKLQYCPSAKLAYLICIALDKNFEDVFFIE